MLIQFVWCSFRDITRIIKSKLIYVEFFLFFSSHESLGLFVNLKLGLFLPWIAESQNRTNYIWVYESQTARITYGFINPKPRIQLQGFPGNP